MIYEIYDLLINLIVKTKCSFGAGINNQLLYGTPPYGNWKSLSL